MSIRIVLIAISALMLASCSNSMHPISRVAPAPEFVQVTGVIHYRSGAAAPFSHLSVIAGVFATDTTSADSLGRYHLTLPFSGDSVTILATQPPPTGIVVETDYNLVKVLPDVDRVLDIVLSRAQPI